MIKQSHLLVFTYYAFKFNMNKQSRILAYRQIENNK